VKLPAGFSFAGTACGIKPHRPDLALVVSDRDAACAGAFTVNRAKAAPVIDAEQRLPAGGMRAIVINSGNANALTGPAGLEAVQHVLAAAASALGVTPAQVVSASTGVIGMKLPHAKIVAALPRLVAELGPEPDRAAEAIMTTDTTRKLDLRRVAGELRDGAGVLAILPGGRGNDFARKLEISHDPVEAAKLLRTGQERRIDLAEAGGQTYLGILSAGFDSDVSRIAPVENGRLTHMAMTPRR